MADGEDSLITKANDLVADGRLDAAEPLYTRALEADPPDPRAGDGLALVQARRAAAQRVADSAKALPTNDDVRDCFRSALVIDRSNAAALAGQDTKAPSAGTAPGRAADRWDAFYKGWVDPLVKVLLPALALLAVLLVLARMVTQMAVPVDAPEWKRPRVAWWVGLVLLVAAAGGAAALAVSRGWVPEGAGWRWGQLGFVFGCLVATGVVLGVSGAWSGWLPVVLVAALGALSLATGVGGEGGWPWVVAFAVACLGVVLVAAGRGRALRLRIQVKRGDQADPTGTAYVLARLQELGSSPPEGLKTPQQVDVTDLPTAALSSLPAGRIAAVIKQVLDLVLPAVPWRATVEDGGGDALVVVTLTRNGAVAQTALVDGARFLQRPATGASPVVGADGKAASPTIDRGDLLTAAAAIILTELAERHAKLSVGLCGARRWDSVAAHVVATKPPGSAGGRELRRELLAYAVDVDPKNALAQAAYVHLLGEDAAEPDELREYAARVLQLHQDIEVQAGADSGYLPLQLRTLHLLTATRLNLAAATTGAVRISAWHLADEAWGWLDAKLDGAGNQDDPFVRGMRAIADELDRALQALLSPAPGAPVHTPGVPPSLHVRYDQACRWAFAGDSTAALDALEIAAGREEFREMARKDPWFAWIRDGDGGSTADQERFWSIVGEPEPALEFTGLDLFGKNGEALRALGVQTAVELLVATWTPRRRRQLAVRLDVPPVVVRRWHRLARLAAPSPGRMGIDGRELELLLAVGIASVWRLLRRTWFGLRRDEVLKATRAVARSRRIPPPGDADVRRWIGWGL